MGKKAAEIGSQFTVALGDNFYHQGVKSVDDSRFKETYEVIFGSDLTVSFISAFPGLKSQCIAAVICLQDVFDEQSLQSRWYVVCGNHDHLGNASAQVAYTTHSKRWYMPDFYYTEVSIRFYGGITRSPLSLSHAYTGDDNPRYNVYGPVCLHRHCPVSWSHTPSRQLQPSPRSSLYCSGRPAVDLDRRNS